MNICVCLSQLFKNDVKKKTCYSVNEKQIISDIDKNNDCKYSMTMYFINFKKRNTCMICLESLNNKQKITTRCNHNFHYKCINSWCDISDNCPLCRCTYPIG